MNRAQPKRIGIIGGAGPWVGGLLFQKIVQVLQEKYGCREDQDFPYMMLLSYPFADMLKKPDDAAQCEIVRNQLKDCFQTLVDNKIDYAVIACNTLHRVLEL